MLKGDRFSSCDPALAIPANAYPRDPAALLSGVVGSQVLASTSRALEAAILALCHAHALRLA